MLASAAIWPEAAGTWKRGSAQPATVADRPLWNEYGFQEAESAVYENAGRRVSVIAWRLQDSTGALGAFDWQRTADARPSALAPLAAQSAEGLLLAHGNYLARLDGATLDKPDVDAFLGALPRVEMASLPSLPGFMPSENRVANSERYVIGPVALERFAPGIPPAVAAFHMGAEAQIGTFRAPGGDLRLAIFNYPTPQIAMQQAEAFQKLPGAMAKRTGPLVAVILSPADANAAEHLLALVRYQGSVTLSERVPTRRDNIGNLILTIFELIGVLLLFAFVSGLAFGGFRAFMRRGARGQDAEIMITLHLADRN